MGTEILLRLHRAIRRRPQFWEYTLSARSTQSGQSKAFNLIGYGVGDFGLNIYWQTVSMFLVYWYTVIAGVDPKIAGFIFFVGMAWDALSDPVVASLSERVSTRFGTYRPFILYGSFFTALAFVLLFWVPPFDGWLKIVILIATCLLFRTSYTIVAIPYAALASRITYDSKERADYSGARMFFGFSALVLVSMFLWPLVEHFTQSLSSEQTAFQVTAAMGGALATIALWICFALTREKPLPAKTVQSEKVWQGIVRNFSSNRALRILLIIILLQTGATTALSITLIFYIEANAGLFAAKEVLFTSFAFAMLICVPFWTYAIRIFGRKKIWIFAVIVHLLVAIHMIVGPPLIVMGVPVHILLFMALGGAFAVIFWAFIPDCVEYGQIQSGYRSEAGVFGSVLIVQKMTGGLMGLVVGFVLSALGMSSQLEQSPEMGSQLSQFIAVFPALLLGLTLIPILLLPMGRDAHKEIIEQLG